MEAPTIDAPADTVLSLGVDLATPIGAVVVAVVGGVVTWYGQAWSERRAGSKALAAILRENRDPLLRSAYDLQSRCYNIVARGFLQTYLQKGDADQQRYAVWSTIWLFAQYLGQVELLRQQVQYLDVGNAEDNRRVQSRLTAVAGTLATDSTEGAAPFIVFRADQRAIGEAMVEPPPNEAGRSTSMGYGKFVHEMSTLTDSGQEPELTEPSPFTAWALRFRRHLDDAAAGRLSVRRLAAVQRALVDLVDVLDPDRVRYPEANFRGRLPASEGFPERPTRHLAHFIWRFEPPAASVVAHWADAERMDAVGGGPNTFRTATNLGRRVVSVFVWSEGDWVSIAASIGRSEPSHGLDARWRGRRARRVVNPLLHRFDRPLVTPRARRRFGKRAAG